MFRSNVANSRNIDAHNAEIQETLVVDSTHTGAFLVRKNEVGQDIVRVDTQNEQVTINADLVVNGNATYTSSDNVSLADALIHLGAGNNADVDDIGFFGEYVSTADSKTHYSGLARIASESDKRYRIFDSTVMPNRVIDSNNYTLGNLEVGDLWGTQRTSYQPYITQLPNATQIRNLTTTELTHLENLDQALKTTDDVNFASVNANSLTTSNINATSMTTTITPNRIVRTNSTGVLTGCNLVDYVAGSNISVTQASGGVIVGIPQAVSTTSDVSFGSLGLTRVNAGDPKEISFPAYNTSDTSQGSTTISVYPSGQLAINTLKAGVSRQPFSVANETVVTNIPQQASLVNIHRLYPNSERDTASDGASLRFMNVTAGEYFFGVQNNTDFIIKGATGASYNSILTFKPTGDVLLPQITSAPVLATDTNGRIQSTNTISLTGATINTLTATSGYVSSLVATNSTLSNCTVGAVTGGSSFFSNVSATGGNFTNLSSTSATITSATIPSLTSTTIAASSGNIGNLISANNVSSTIEATSTLRCVNHSMNSVGVELVNNNAYIDFSTSTVKDRDARIQLTNGTDLTISTGGDTTTTSTMVLGKNQTRLQSTITTIDNAVGIGHTNTGFSTKVNIAATSDAYDATKYSHNIQSSLIDDGPHVSCIKSGNHGMTFGSYNTLWGYGGLEPTLSAWRPSYINWEVSNGNVGVGTISANCKLFVNSSTADVYGWKGRVSAGNQSTNAVCIGEYNTRACIAGHNGALNAYAPTYIGWVGEGTSGDTVSLFRASLENCTTGSIPYIGTGKLIESKSYSQVNDLIFYDANRSKVATQSDTIINVSGLNASPSTFIMNWAQCGSIVTFSVYGTVTIATTGVTGPYTFDLPLGVGQTHSGTSGSCSGVVHSFNGTLVTRAVGYVDHNSGSTSRIRVYMGHFNNTMGVVGEVITVHISGTYRTTP